MSFHNSLQTIREEKDSKDLRGFIFPHEIGAFPGSLSVEPARLLACPNAALRLASSLPLLNLCLAGGIPFGSLSEWGLPLGHYGREVILSFLAKATQGASPHWVLWAHSRARIQVYPPAWRARGVNLSRMRFTKSLDPIRELKPLLLDPFFKIIVFDAPERLGDEDYAFLARQARIHKKVVLVLHDHFLSSRKGNLWAKLRLNVWRDLSSRKMCLRVIRGLSPRQLSFELECS